MYVCMYVCINFNENKIDGFSHLFQRIPAKITFRFFAERKLRRVLINMDGVQEKGNAHE